MRIAVLIAAAALLVGGGVAVARPAAAGGADLNTSAHARPAPLAPAGSGGSGSDFNGDGRNDLVVGAPMEDVGDQKDAGAIFVFYGSITGITTANVQRFTQDSAGVADTAEAGDHFGQATAAGDFNGDGFPDLAIGVPGEDRGVTDRGAINMLYGGYGGLTANPSMPLVVPAPAGSTGAQAGYALASGDVSDGSQFADGAGGTDLVVGMPGYQGHGGVRVVPWQKLNTAGYPGTYLDVPYRPVSAGARLGTTVGVLLGIGHQIAAGAPHADVTVDTTVVHDAGLLAVFRGSTSRLISQANISSNPPQTGDRFGASLAIGSFDAGTPVADGIDDILIGAPGEDFAGAAEAGIVHVFLSEAPGGTTTSGLRSIGRWFTLNENSVAVPGVRSAGDQFGASVAWVDLGFTGGRDFAIGVPGDDDGAPGGALVVMYNDGTGKAFNDKDFLNVKVTQASTGIPNAPRAGDSFGASLWGAQVRSDPNDPYHFEDLAIGVPGEAINGYAKAGAVEILHGDYEGPVHDRYLSEDTANVPDAAEAGDRFGLSLGPDLP